MVMAELGEPYKGKVESMPAVMKEAKPVSKAGEYFTYSSTATQALVILTEAVTRQTWADAFDQRIWSKMGVEGNLQVHLSPRRIRAWPWGSISSTARSGTFWNALHTELEQGCRGAGRDTENHRTRAFPIEAGSSTGQGLRVRNSWRDLATLTFGPPDGNGTPRRMTETSLRAG